MKIILYNDFERIIGGTEVYQRTLAKALCDRGHEILEIFGTKSDFPRSNRAFQKMLLLNSMKIHAEVREKIRKEAGRFGPDIIYINNNKIFTKTVLETFHEEGYPVISAFHDFHFLYRNQSFFGIRKWWKRHLFKLVEKRSSAFCSLTRIIESELKLYSGKKVFYLPLFVDEHIWQYRPDCHLNRPRIVFFGRMEEAKGIFFLWEAFKKVVKSIENSELVFIGGGTDLDRIKAMAVQSEYREKVVFKGRLAQGELLKELHQSGVAVVPTITEEPFGMTGIEAQSAGVPVVASRVGGIPEWCVNGETGLLVTPGNVKELAEALVRILSDKALARQLSVKAKENCIRRFGKDRIVAKTERMFAEVAAGR